MRSTSSGIDFDSVTAVWYRRPISAMPRRLFRTESYFVARERDDALEGFFLALQQRGVALYNLPSANYASATKPAQYAAAVRHGLQVPETLISNDPQMVREFLQQNERAILKGVSLSGLDTGDKHYAIFVSEVDEHAFSTLDERLPPCPVTVQQLIDWAHAARLILVDDRVWCFTTARAAQLDWRLDTRARWQSAAIPAEIRGSLTALHASLGLRYGCVDMLIDTAGVWWFLETNANGQWLWLEESSGFPLSAEMAQALLSQHHFPQAA